MFKRKPKSNKPFYKKTWFIVLVALLVIGAFGGGDKDEKPIEENKIAETEIQKLEETIKEVDKTVDESTKEVAKIEVEEPAPVEAPVIESPTEPDPIEVENTESKKEFNETETKALEDLALIIMENNFKDMAEITLDRENKIFNVKPINDVATAVVLLGTTHKENTQMLDSWKVLVDGFKKMSEGVKETLPGYFVNLLNPANEELSVLSIYDGIVIYDFTNEFK